MTWVEGKIGDFADIRHGFAFKSKFFVDDGDFVVLTPGNCHEGGGFKSKGEKEKFYKGGVPDGYLLNKGDVVVVMTDLVGTAPVLGGAFIIPDANRFLHNQRLGLVEVTRPELMEMRFLYFLFNTYNYRAQVRGSASGATVRHTSPARIKSCRVKYPRDVHVQMRIADILFAYEDLIENNRRRIALLEEAARMLYREWFVCFRFPGHEHVKIKTASPRAGSGGLSKKSLMLCRKFASRPTSKKMMFTSAWSIFLDDHSRLLIGGRPGILQARRYGLEKTISFSAKYGPIFIKSVLRSAMV